MKHTTRDGEKMWISQMSDDHLGRTIEMHLRNLRNAKKALDAKITGSEFRKALYGVTDEDLADKAKETIRNTSRILPKYIFEAQIRGINYSEKLQDVYERSAMEGAALEIQGADLPELEEGEDPGF